MSVASLPMTSFGYCDLQAFLPLIGATADSRNELNYQAVLAQVRQHRRRRGPVDVVLAGGGGWSPSR